MKSTPMSQRLVRRILIICLSATAPSLMSLPASAQSSEQLDTDSNLLEDFMRMNQSQLDMAYHHAEAGTIPNGVAEGRAAFFPGAVNNIPVAMLARIAWQGQVSNRDKGYVLNRVFGLRLLPARMYIGKSLYDGKDSIIIDYSRTSLLFHKIRDEIREIGPGFYLGRAYIKSYGTHFLAVNFALDFNK